MFPRLFSHKKALSRHEETEAATDFRFSILIFWGTCTHTQVPDPMTIDPMTIWVHAPVSLFLNDILKQLPILSILVFTLTPLRDIEFGIIVS